MLWKKLPGEDLLRRSHHAMHVFGQTAFVVGGYSWSEGKAMKLFPLNEFTRIIFSDELAVQMVDVIEVTVPQRCTVPLCISGFQDLMFDLLPGWWCCHPREHPCFSFDLNILDAHYSHLD